MSTVTLERPDLFESKFPLSPAPKIGKSLLLSGQRADGSAYQPNIAVLVRTKNDQLGLERVLNHVLRLRSTYAGRVDVIAVDTESSDNTLKLAKDFGATVVPITQAEFSYPKAMNRGLDAVAKDVTATFITVGHAQPTLSNSLSSGVRHFKDNKVVGVYGRALVHENASIWEKLFFQNLKAVQPEMRVIKQLRLGVMGATNCFIRMETWRKYPFDEAYAAGGEDTIWAKDALARGEIIIFDAITSVHHSHNLSLLNIYRQRVHWAQIVKGPRAFDTEEMKRRRPDLFTK